MISIRSITLGVLVGALACGNSQPDRRPRTMQELMARKRLEDTRPDSFTIAADRGRIEGDSAARVWLVVAGDFQCAECKSWNDDVLPAVRKEYVANGRVRLAFLNLPQPAHLNAMTAALSAGCASANGRFWETASRIFATQALWKGLPDARPFLDSLAISVGVDAATQHSCSERARPTKLVNEDVARLKESGVDAAPTYLIGTRQLTGRASLATFRAALDSALAPGK